MYRQYHLYDHITVLRLLFKMTNAQIVTFVRFKYINHSNMSSFISVVQLGSLLAFILGASVLTVLEFCDILLAWIADRFFSEGSKATREIPPEYRDKIKSRESLGSSRASMDLNNSLNSQKRSYVTFRDFNNVNGSEV